MVATFDTKGSLNDSHLQLYSSRWFFICTPFALGLDCLLEFTDLNWVSPKN